jgi:hypothetical protein
LYLFIVFIRIIEVNMEVAHDLLTDDIDLQDHSVLQHTGPHCQKVSVLRTLKLELVQLHNWPINLGF